jgi:two-component system sensor histidine kinase UhpB
MRKQLQSPLARRLVVAIILVSSAITLCLTALQLYGEYRGELGDIQADFRRIEEVHLKSLTQSLWATNADDLKLRVEGMVRVPNLEYVAVREGDRFWAQAGRRTSRNVIERQYVMTQVHRGRTLEIGVLTVVAGLDAVYRKLVNRAFTVLASNALKTLLVAGFAFAFFHRLVNRHLLAIAENVRGLDLRGRAPPLILARAAGRRADELDEVTAAINLMHEQVYSTLAVLRESSERLRLAVQASNVGLWDRDLRSNRVVYSREWKAQLGHEEHEIGDEYGEWERRVHPEDLAPTLERIQRYLARPEGAHEAEFRMRHKNGTWHWIYARGEVFRDSDGKPERMMGCHVDITERKRAEEALRESRARLEALTRRLLEVQETERRSIARELHDEVGGVLTAVKLNLQSLRRPRTGDAAEAALADGLALVDGAIQSVRSLSLDLRPAVLDDLGLIPALKSYCERQAQRAGIPIELALDAIDVKPAPQLESACFRIVQESVTNALRHANARRIQIALHRVDASFSLEIADDGDGFDVAAARKRGFAGASIGLLGMEERANLLGGRLSIDSAPGAGVRVRVEFSMPEEGSS